MSEKNPVRTLNPEVARKIAAGEVIDRPNAIIRELMDNSIDAGATSITVEISGGGIDKIRIIDDGTGMTKEDLENCARPHATSKISSEVDLMNLSTLGFRGEALASIAAVARLSIQSGGFKMRASITEDHIIEAATPLKGTIVQSEGLFENFPARRQFLKRPATEGIMCRNTFIEKALPRPDIAFRFVVDGETKIDLPAGQSLKERFVCANNYNQGADLFFEFSQSENGKPDDDKNEWAFTVVIGEPAVSRTNKKEIFIYANGRRIQEYSLVQAVEYGCQGFFPNGTYPVAAVFARVRPDLIDFNIHPAKKEARFSDISALHHGLSTSIRTFFHQYTYSNFKEDKTADEIRENEFDFTIPDKNETASTSVYEKHISYKASETKSDSLSDFRSKYLGIKTGDSGSKSSSLPVTHNTTKSLAEEALAATMLQASKASQKPASENTSSPLSNQSKIRYIGPCLGTFLLAEKNNCLYIIDQHAAHERILFDRLMNSQGNSARQPLLIPYKIKTESKSQDNQLEKLKKELTRIGFETEHTADGLWEIKTIPERWTGTEYELRTLLFVKQVEPKEIIRSIAAMTACKAAVKDGYVLDDITAARLAEQAFTLEDPHCPHGRPIYTVISREKLFELVKRT